MMQGDVAQLEEHLLCKQGVVGSSPIISTTRYPNNMDKKDLKNLSESELRELKESINEVLEERKYRESYLKTNPKGVAIAWIVVAVILSVYRYITT
tara:strand:- start:167 stop:454 length:288 start_codon:yes stop_codon:yes gene_type:complete